MGQFTAVRDLYQDFFKGFELAEPLVGRCSAPLLVSPPAEWPSARLKLLLVGQEMLGSGAAEGDRGEAAILRLTEFLSAPDGVATLHLELGSPLKIVSEWLGHSTIQQTANTYQHVSSDVSDDYADRFVARLAAAVKKR